MKESDLPIVFANYKKIEHIPFPLAKWDDPCYRKTIVIPNDGLCSTCNVCNYFIPDDAPQTLDEFIEYYEKHSMLGDV